MLQFVTTLIEPSPFRIFGWIGLSVAALMIGFVWAACCSVIFNPSQPRAYGQLTEGRDK